MKFIRNSIFTLLLCVAPFLTKAQMTLELVATLPAENGVLLKGSPTALLYFFTNTGSTPIPGPLTLEVKYFLDGNQVDDNSFTVNTSSLAPNARVTQQQNQPFFFAVGGDDTENLGDEYELMIAFEYESNDEVFYDTLRRTFEAQEPSATLDLALNDIQSPAPGSNVNLDQENVEFILQIENVDDEPIPAGVTIPTSVEIDGINITQQPVNVNIGDQPLEANETRNFNLNIPSTLIRDIVGSGGGDFEICMTIAFAFDVNPENNTQCATYGIVSSVEGLEGLVESLKAYPNPTQDMINFELNTLVNEQVNISILNLQGQVVENVHNGMLNAGNHNLQMNVENLKAGAYIYTVTIDGKVATGKFIKQ